MQVNSAIEEAAGRADANMKLMQAAKSGGAKLTPAERKRATDLLHNIAVSYLKHVQG